MSRELSDMWRSVVQFLPLALAFVAILIVGYLLARLARTVTGKALRRVGFDRAVRRGPAARVFPEGAPGVTDVCARLAFFVVLLIAFQLAFGLWGPNPVSDLINALIGWLPQVFVAIVIVVAAAAVAGAAHDLIVAALGGLGYARVLAKAVAAVIVTLGVIAGLDQVGIATSVTRPLLIAILATVAGVIVVGVGGGLIRPMQQRWDVWLDRAATESAAIRRQARAYAEERARLAAEEARRAEDARLAEETRLAEEARAADEVRRVEEARLAQESREAHRAGEEREAQTRRDEDARRAEQVRLSEEPGATEGLAEEQQRAGRAHGAGGRRGEEPAPDETQIIVLPGFDASPGDHPTEIFPAGRGMDVDDTTVIRQQPAGPGGEDSGDTTVPVESRAGEDSADTTALLVGQGDGDSADTTALLAGQGVPPRIPPRCWWVGAVAGPRTPQSRWASHIAGVPTGRPGL